jgi:alkyl sulfatase BDS1-like metallo-beta-lactamase superfamily hydrolase
MVLEGPMGRLAFLGLISGQTTAAQLMESGVLKIDGDPTVLARFATLFDKPPADFGLVMP